MRTIAAIAALLLACAWAWAQDAEEPAKVLGFTLGEPPPEDAVLDISAGRYGRYELEHRWCWELYAVTVNGSVVRVWCNAKSHFDMKVLLQSRYGAEKRVEVSEGRWGLISAAARLYQEADRWTTPNGLSILLEDVSEGSLLWMRLEATHGLLEAPGIVHWLRTTTLDELEGLAYSPLRPPPIIEADLMLAKAWGAKRDAAIVRRENADGEDF